MNVIKYICVYLLILLLPGCQTKQNYKTTIATDTIGLQFLGMWQVVPRPIPYGALITLDSNHTFTYRGGGCMSHFGSSGTWFINGDTLVLNSRDTSACVYTNPFGVNCFSLDSSYTRDKNIEDCEPEDDFFEHIIFSDERFLLIDDTLCHIRRTENICPQAKDNFYRFRKKVVQ